MGPTEDNKQDGAAMSGPAMPADGGAMPPAQGTPPAGGAMMGGGMAMPPEPDPNEVSMGDETLAAMPEAPAGPAMAGPSAPAAAPGPEAPNDTNAGMPPAPQQ